MQAKTSGSVAYLSVTGLTAAVIMLLSSGSAVLAGTYTGNYDSLSQYHATITTSSTAYNQGVDGYQWAAAGPGSTDNSVDRWLQLTWDNDVTLNNIRTQTWNQIGTNSTWYIQTSPDGVGSWTNWYTGSGTGFVSAPGSATVRAARVFFPAGQYTLNGGGGYGPGLYLLQTEGTYSGGINDTDPQFNILGTTGGYLGTSPSITMPAANEGPTTILMDGIIPFDGPRAGWYPAQDGTEHIDLNLGSVLSIKGVKLYPGTAYSYLPPTADVYTSMDGSTYTLAGTMSNGTIKSLTLGSPVVGQYIRLQNLSPNGYGGYILPTELEVSAFGAPNINVTPGNNSTIDLGTGISGETLTSLNAITLQNNGATSSELNILSFSITGSDAAVFDIPDFLPTTLTAGGTDTVMFDLAAILGGAGVFDDALLTIHTNMGDILFNLQAEALPAPEPSSLLLLGLGTVLFSVRRKRTK